MGEAAVTSYVMRPIRQSDVSALSNWLENLDDLALFDRCMRVPLGPNATDALWKDVIEATDHKKRLWFGIVDSTDNTVGVIGLESISAINGDAVLAMIMAPEARNKGIGVRASSLMIDIAFQQLRLRRLTSYYRADNGASAFLIDQAGFQKEGVMRQAWFSNGKFHDTIAVGLLLDEWLERRTVLARDISRDCIVSFGQSASTTWNWPPLDG